jgi:hypothetical protein
VDAAQVDGSGKTVDPASPAALRASLAGLRSELAKAQRLDPKLNEIIQHLRGKPAGEYLAEPRGPAGKQKVRRRALQFRLTTDKLLVAKNEGDEASEDLPCIPEVPHESGVEGAPTTQTWKHMLLGAVHNTTTGQHRSAPEMFSELSKLVSWFPPEKLLEDCKTWRRRCKLCTSVFSKPGAEAAYVAVRASRPFYRLQLDLLEIKPTGSRGEKYILTVICVATRYIFLRCTDNRDSIELAKLMLDVILDAGVVPAILQSDNEFANLAFEELFYLLGSHQIFSTALRPQSQGIIERSHLDIRRNLAILVEAWVRSMPRNWPEYVRHTEHKIRHKTLCTGASP